MCRVDGASKVLLVDMYRVERRFATERQMAKEGTLLGLGFRTDPNPRFGGSSSGSSSDSSSGSEEAEPKAMGRRWQERRRRRPSRSR